jgi:hypothetical protein
MQQPASWFLAAERIDRYRRDAEQARRVRSVRGRFSRRRPADRHRVTLG